MGQTVVTVPLTWVKEIEQAYENFNNQDIAKLLSSSSLSAHPCFGFLNVLTPLLAQGIIKLEAGLNNIQNLPKNLNNINDILLEGLPEQLLLMVNTTLVLELNVARLQGLLKGDNAQARFSSFIQRLKNPEVQLALWEEYPVLARQVLETINRWVEFVNFKECHSADELERFYQRQGGYLGLLYSLEATDFHFENLIAAGEYPILIDLESLFHPRHEITTIAADTLDREISKFQNYTNPFTGINYSNNRVPLARQKKTATIKIERSRTAFM